jgi:hypothetical protein
MSVLHRAPSRLDTYNQGTQVAGNSPPIGVKKEIVTPIRQKNRVFKPGFSAFQSAETEAFSPDIFWISPSLGMLHAHPWQHSIPHGSLKA